MVSEALSLPVRAVPRKQGWVRSWWGLVRWSLVRHKYLLPAFTVMQALFAVAIVYGLALLVPEVNVTSARYLSAGAWTLGIIAVGCVLAPQVMSTAKKEGLLDYQKTLGVPRSAILLADAIVWNIGALPGLALGMVAASTRFNLVIHVDFFTVIALLGAQFAVVSIGYAIAFWLSTNASALVTQVIMIGGLLFSPITFPAERLPDWATILHQFLPFAPLGSIIREAAFRTGEPQMHNCVVVAVWAAMAYSAAYLALQRRN